MVEKTSKQLSWDQLKKAKKEAKEAEKRSRKQLKRDLFGAQEDLFGATSVAAKRVHAREVKFLEEETVKRSAKNFSFDEKDMDMDALEKMDLYEASRFSRKGTKKHIPENEYMKLKSRTESGRWVTDDEVWKTYMESLEDKVAKRVQKKKELARERKAIAKEQAAIAPLEEKKDNLDAVFVKAKRYEPRVRLTEPEIHRREMKRATRTFREVKKIQKEEKRERRRVAREKKKPADTTNLVTESGFSQGPGLPSMNVEEKTGVVSLNFCGTCPTCVDHPMLDHAQYARRSRFVTELGFTVVCEFEREPSLWFFSYLDDLEIARNLRDLRTESGVSNRIPPWPVEEDPEGKRDIVDGGCVIMMHCGWCHFCDAKLHHRYKMKCRSRTMAYEVDGMCVHCRLHDNEALFGTLQTEAGIDGTAFEEKDALPPRDEYPTCPGDFVHCREIKLYKNLEEKKPSTFFERLSFRLEKGIYGLGGPLSDIQNWWKSDFEEVDYFIRIVGAIYLCWRNPEPLAVSAVCYFALGNDFTVVQKSIFSAGIGTFVKLIPKRESKPVDPSQLQTEAGIDDALDAFDEFLRFSHDSTVSRLLRDLIVNVTALRVFPKELAMDVYRFLGKPTGNGILEILKNALMSLSKLMRVSLLILRGVPLHDVFFMQDPLEKTIAASKELLKYKDLTYTGLPSPGKICRKKFIADATAFSAFLVNALKTMSLLSPGYDTCSSLRLELDRTIAVLRGTLVGQKRAMPIGVIVPGDPGIGKSNILDFVATVHGDVMGRTYDDSQKFTRVKTSEYWEGYDPMSHPVVRFPELATDHLNIVKSQGDPLIAELTAVVDSQPYTVDMAFEGKGKIFVLAELVIADTNNESLNLDHLVQNPAAYRRRFIYIVPTVKPQYRKSGSNQIDSDIPAEGHAMDKWFFDVYRYSAVDIKTSKKEYKLKGGDIYELRDLLTEMFREHIESEERNLACVRDPTFFRPVRDDKKEGLQTEAGVVFTRIWTRNPTWRQKLSTYKEFMRTGMVFLSRTICYSILAAALDSALPLIPDYQSWEVVGEPHPLVAWMSVLLLGWAIYYRSLWAFVLAFVLQLTGFSPKKWAARYGKVRARKLAAKSRVRANYYWDQSLFYLGLTSKMPLMLAKAAPIAAFCALSVGVLGTVIHHVRKKKRVETESSVFRLDGEENKELEALEKSFHCGKSYTRVPNKLSEQWNVRHTLYPSLHVGDLESLERRVSSNVRSCWVIAEKKRDTYVLGICKNYALVNTHSLGKMERFPILVQVSRTGTMKEDDNYAESLLSQNDIRILSGDVSMVRLSGCLFSDVLNHLPGDSVFPKYGRGRIGGSPVDVFHVERPLSAEDRVVGTVHLDTYFTYKWPDHSIGSCGIPLILNKDRGNSIVGIHCFGSRTTSDAFASPLYRNEIEDAILSLESGGLMPLVSQSGISPLPMEEPIPKSPFRHLYLPGLEYYGKLPGPVMVNNKSNLRESFLCSSGYLEKIFMDTLDFIPTTSYTRPMMAPKYRDGEYVSPTNITLEKMTLQRKPLDRELVRHVVNLITQRMLKKLRAKGVSLSPLDIETAVNGIDSDQFARRVATTTAAGFGFEGPKGKYLPIVYEDQKSLVREPVSELKKKILGQVNTYQSGSAVGYVYRASLKDEPREHSKALTGNTRMFFASGLDNLILCKMFLSPFYTLLIEDGDLACTAIGIDMHRQAHEIYEYLTEFSPHIMEGDYSKYDIGMPFEIGWGANTVVYNVLEACGYNSAALEIVRGLLTDSIFPFVDMNLDLFCLPALQPSGRYATAEDNSLRGLILMMYAWYSNEHCRDFDFFEHVRVKLYGDDALGSVAPKFAPHFNNEWYAGFVREAYGMDFTSSDKRSVLKKFVDKKDMSFLKRNFRKHPELGRIVAPLDMNSIYKTLQWYSPSKSVNAETQYESIFVSCLREFFFHLDRVKYGKVRALLLEAYVSHFGKAFGDAISESLPTYDFLIGQLSDYEAVKPSSTLRVGAENAPADAIPHDPMGSQGDCVAQQRGTVVCSGSQTSNPLPCPSDGIDIGTESGCADVYLNYLRDFSLTLRKELVRAQEALDDCKCPLYGHTVREIRMSHQYATCAVFAKHADEYFAVKNRVDELAITIESIERAMRKIENRKLQTESGVSGEQTTGVPTTIDEKQNFVDMGGEDSEEVTAGPMLPSSILSMTDLPLSAFLSRPVEIASLSWVVGSYCQAQYDPWTLFLSAPSVRAKLRNYAFLFGNLHVRIAMSGTPFHRGKLLAAYVPQCINNEIGSYYKTFASGGGDPAQVLKWLTQIRGGIVMDPKDNAPTDISCPFVSFKRAVRLFNKATTALAAGSAFDDASNLGVLFLQSFYTLASATATPSNVNIFVYAWMTDVQVGPATGTQLAITTESGIDERKSGPVETYATRSAEVAEALTAVPWISPFARASGMMLRGLAGLSAVFGWSFPAITTAPSRMKNEPYQNAANVIGYDTAQRLTLDPRQELTVDPRVVAIDEDDMTIAAICRINSWIDRANWAHTSPAMTPIWSAIVTPRSVAPHINITNFVQPSALYFAATPFEYWRGDITYRIEVVCSNFDRGKLGILYEPNVAQYALVTSSLSTNKQYMHVMDIQETQTCEFTVEWAFSRDWCRNATTADSYTTIGTNVANPLNFVDCCNGFITIFPLTILQTPDDGDIHINVYIRSDNMKFNYVNDQFLPLDITTESGCQSSYDVETCVLNPSHAKEISLSELFFGESPVSFRSLLKRYYVSGTYSLTLGAGPGIGYMRFESAIIPNLVPSHSSPTSTNTSLLSYLRYAYVALRGSFKKRIRLIGNAATGGQERVNITLQAPTNSVTIPGMVAASSPFGPRLNGTLSFIPFTNGGVECELPFYTNNLYVTSGTNVPWDVSDTMMDTYAVRDYVWEMETQLTGNSVSLIEETAAGEDFALMRFLAAPPFHTS